MTNSPLFFKGKIILQPPQEYWKWKYTTSFWYYLCTTLSFNFIQPTPFPLTPLATVKEYRIKEYSAHGYSQEGKTWGGAKILSETYGGYL